MDTTGIASTGIEVMISGFLGAAIAQLLKTFWYLAHKKPLNFRILVETGGMPSSHSAAMTAMATSVVWSVALVRWPLPLPSVFR